MKEPGYRKRGPFHTGRVPDKRRLVRGSQLVYAALHCKRIAGQPARRRKLAVSVGMKSQVVFWVGVCV